MELKPTCITHSDVTTLFGVDCTHSVSQVVDGIIVEDAGPSGDGKSSLVSRLFECIDTNSDDEINSVELKTTCITHSDVTTLFGVDCTHSVSQVVDGIIVEDAVPSGDGNSSLVSGGKSATRNELSYTVSDTLAHQDDSPKWAQLQLVSIFRLETMVVCWALMGACCWVTTRLYSQRVRC